MEVIGSALLSAVFEQLMEKLTLGSSLSFVRETQVLNKLKKWEGMLAAIHAVLDDADEKKLANEFVGKWVSKLTDLAFDIDDLLDEFAAEAQRRRESKQQHQKKRSKVIRKFLPSITGFRFNSEMDSKIEQVSNRLQQLLEQRTVLGLSETVAGDKQTSRKKKKKQPLPPTTSLVNEATIWGREKDKEAVLELLRREEEGEDNGRRLSVISITGMGGLGKTSLAQLVYNDALLSSEFSFKAWVSLGGDFDPEAITRTILDGSPRGGEDLNFLQLKLKEKLLGKKFLIVLDDVWTDKYTDWTLLCNPLEFGARGSKIIVTTRLQDVAKMVGTPAGDRGYVLGQLEYDDCLSVFLYHALEASNFDVHPGLEETGKAIVRKCRGLPLAAKVIGGLLRGEHNVDVWREVLRSSLWESSVVKTNILPALMLSYDHLPSHLKVCFAYCAVFPKGYVFDEEELVLLWMAEGFLQQQQKISNNGKHPKQLGHEYFRVLVSRSFFQQSGASSVSQYVMHDMMSDLARFVSSGVCSNLDDFHCDESRIRHLAFAQRYYDSWLRFGTLEKTKHLRTFLPVGLSQHSNSYYISTKVVHDLVPKLKRLRVLSFARYKVKELPDTIGGLKHLRMLNLSFTEITTLPESTGKLFNLQTLLLKGCRELCSLPSSLGDLINLECLDVRGASKLNEIPIEVLNLPLLKFLPVFMVCAAENGIGIAKLAKFTPLQGVFRIEGLHNVKNPRHAELVSLKAKKAIGGLVFDWSDDPDPTSRDGTVDFQVLESLEPHVDVSGVKIHSYGGTKLPMWVGDSSFSNLTTLSFERCQRITSLPHLGQLASLKKLMIFECSNLAGFPTNLPSLAELCIRGCQATTLQTSNVNHATATLPSLVTCRIERISGLGNLDGTFLQDLATLETLEIRGCHDLQCLWNAALNPVHLTGLTTLAVWDCASLVSLTGFEHETSSLPRNLETLKIRACHGLKNLTSDFDNLTSLSVLHILDCSNLASISPGGSGGGGGDRELPGGLQELAIQGCGSLQSLPVVSHGHNARLEKLTVEMPVSLKQPWIPKGEFPESLKYIEITKWTSLLLQRLQQSRLPQLTRLVMGDSPDVETIPSLYQWKLLLSTPSAALTELHIWGCHNLTCLPDQAMQTLTSLRSLYICGCESLEQLTHGGRGLPSTLDFLLVDECPTLRQPVSEWKLYTLTSLHQLTIIGPNPATDMVTSLPDDDGGGGGGGGGGRLPPSLTHLTLVGFKNLISISSSGIHTLTSLQQLSIEGCFSLQEFPKGGFPPTLGSLWIYKCPLIGKKCLRGKGAYWPILKDIPHLNVRD